MFDVPPAFKLPRQWHRGAETVHINQDVAVLLTSLRRLWSLELPGDQGLEWLGLFESMSLFSHTSFEAFVVRDSQRPGNGSAEKGLWTNFVIHRLLSYRPMQQSPHVKDSHIQEACRLGSLLYMVPVWRLFGVRPITSATLLANLHDVLQDSNNLDAWGRLWTLRLWVLYMGAVEALGMDARLEVWFLDQVASVCLCNGINSWSDGVALVREVLWFACLFEDRSSQLEEKMSLRFAQQITL